MAIFGLFLLLLGLVGTSSGVDVSIDRSGGGDFTNFNTLVNPLVLNLDLSIEPKIIRYKVLGITFKLKATIGDKGFCRDLRINEGGDLLVNGEFLDEDTIVPGFEGPLKTYQVEINASQVQFECTIPLKVEVEGALDFVNTVDGFGDLTFRSENAKLSQRMETYSPDYVTSPPVNATPTSCFPDPGLLTYKGDDLGEIAGIGITGLVIDELESDPSYVFNDVGIELCKLGEDLANIVSNLLVSDALTDTSSPFYTANPFVANEEGEIPAVKMEKKMREELGDESADLLDLSDQDNLFVSFMVPEDPEEESIISQILEFITDPLGESDIDPLLLFLEDLFPDSIKLEENGTIFDIDILTPLKENGINTFINYTLVAVDLLKLSFSVEITKIEFDIFPPVAEEEGEKPPPILPSFQNISTQTLFLDGVNLGAFFLDTSFKIKFNAFNPGIPGNIYLEEPFDIDINEDLDIGLNWDGFVAAVGLLFAVNTETVVDTQIAPLLQSVIDCVLAFFQIPPTITGATIGHELLSIFISQFDDAIFVLFADIVDVLLPVFQPVLPRAIELIVASTVTDKPLINATVCPKLPTFLDDINKFPYDFTEGFIKEVSDLVNEQLVMGLLQNFDIPNIPITIFGHQTDPGRDPGIGFSMPVPPIQGWAQNVSVYLQLLSLNGAIPPILNELTVLKVIEGSEHYPQDITTVFDLGVPPKPVKLRAVFNVTANEPFIDEDVPASQVSELPPDEIRFQENILDLSFTFSNLRIVLDVFGRYTAYDINSFGLGDLINLGCWGERLNFPGGVTELTVGMTGVSVTGTCDCETPYMLKTFDTFMDETTQAAQFEFWESIFDRFGELVVDLFTPKNFEVMATTASEICETKDWGAIKPPEFAVIPYRASFASLLPFFAFFTFAIITPLMVGRILRRYGPPMTKRYINKEHNTKATKVALNSQESDTDMLESEHLLTSLAKNPAISLIGRIVFSVLLLINFILFLIGNTAYTLDINMDGNVFGIPYKADALRSLNVARIIFRMLSNGGILFGLLLFFFSILWPYARLILIGVAWFTPPSKISVERRGKIIEFLDFLGRFSFVELYFLFFLLVVFQFEGGTPTVPFLPEEDFMFIILQSRLRRGLAAFCLAVSLSLALTNTMNFWQHSIEDRTRIKLREKHLKRNEDEARLITKAEDFDKRREKLSGWSFTVFEKDEENAVKHHYSFKITPFAIYATLTSVILSLICLIGAAFAAAIEVKIYGFFSYLLYWADSETEFTLSVVQLFTDGLAIYSDNAPIYYAGLLFIASVTIFPLIQAFLMVVLLMVPVSVKTARKLAEIHHILSVWTCVDVFAVATVLTVMNLPIISEIISNNLGFCENIGAVMKAYLEPMGFVSETDVDAGCFSMRSSIHSGAYLTITSVFVLSMANFIVSRLYFSYIADRERMLEVAEDVLGNEHTSKVPPEANNSAEVKGYHKRLQKLGLIKIRNTSLESTLQRHPMYLHKVTFADVHYSPPPTSRAPKGASEVVVSKNPMFAADEESLVADFNESKDAKLKRLEVKLAQFYEENDPESQHLTQNLAKEAISRKNGVQKLHKKLEEKYGKTIDLEDAEVDF